MDDKFTTTYVNCLRKFLFVTTFRAVLQNRGIANLKLSVAWIIDFQLVNEIHLSDYTQYTSHKYTKYMNKVGTTGTANNDTLLNVVNVLDPT